MNHRALVLSMPTTLLALGASPAHAAAGAPPATLDLTYHWVGFAALAIFVLA